MKMTWFEHDPMTSLEASELIARYEVNGIKTQKHLSSDLKSFCVFALLPEGRNTPRVSNKYQQRIWA